MTAERPTARRTATARPRSASGRFVKGGGTAAEEPAKKPATSSSATAEGSSTRAAMADGPARAGRGALELYVLRHADAGDPMEWAGDDADRPLSKKGRRQSKRLGDLLDALGFEPDALITSPKLRALDTAKIVGRRLGAKATVDQRLAGGVDADDVAALINDAGAEATSVVIVGHDPDFSELVSWLVGSPIELRKGALARVDLPERELGPGRGLLRWLLPPDAVAR